MSNVVLATVSHNVYIAKCLKNVAFYNYMIILYMWRGDIPFIFLLSTTMSRVKNVIWSKQDANPIDGTEFIGIYYSERR